jgi:hypothetical protein
MLISFSHPQMRPWIEAGLRQFRGEDVGTARVKRQTIRRMGPRYERLLHLAGPLGGINADLGSLHLWWKSRTPARCTLGVVSPYRIRAITIERAENEDDGKHDWLMAHLAKDDGPAASWMIALDDGIDLRRPLAERPPRIAKLIYADGFDSIAAFADFFVPKAGDTFNGVLLQW